MPRLSLLVVLSAVTSVATLQPVHAVNSITVESKSFAAGTPACTVGVYITNDIPLAAIVLALEMRTLTGGAFIGGTIDASTFKWGAVPGERVDNSPLGPEGPNWPAAILITNSYATPEGTCADPHGTGNTTFKWEAPLPDGISPDGFLHAGISVGNPGVGELAELDPGSDPAGAPSFRFVFPLGDNAGTFIIDSSCMTPANVCSFFDIEANIYYAQMNPGIITVTGCECDCLGDPVCDGTLSDLPDVVSTIGVAVRGYGDFPDPNPGCPLATTDVDCSGVTDVIDVVRMINVAFGGAEPTTEYCDPCQ